MIKIIDSHSHLNDEHLINSLDEIYKNMKDFGVYKVLIPSWDYESSKLALEIANKYENTYVAVGIHPLNIEGKTIEDVDKLREFLDDPKVIAIGEIGLDYHYRSDNKEDQKAFLVKQLELSYEYDLPVVIHMRDATEDYLNLIKEFIKNHRKRLNLGIMHSYSGSKETMDELLKLGFLISFSGPVTFKNSRILKDCALNCPIDKMLVETDAPYLTPEPKRGQLNEPANVYYVLKYISELKGITFEDLSYNIKENFNSLFKMED